MNKILNVLRKPTAKEIAARDLEEARRQLLKEQSRADYHSKMAEYCRATVSRLDRYLKEDGE